MNPSPIAYPTEWPHFFTATNLNWLFLLAERPNKNIIIQSLRYLVQTRAVRVHAFVIMSNHIHLIWQPLPGHTRQHVQFRFMKHTGQQLKKIIEVNHPNLLSQCHVNKIDREFQIWKRLSLSIPLLNAYIFEQKKNYIHYNPVKAGLCRFPEQYEFSSAAYYYCGIDRFGLFEANDHG